jgi:hypothetical protein
MAITQALDALGPDAEGLQGGAVTAAAVVTAAALVEAASTAVAFMEASLAVGSTVEDFTEDFTADFTDARLQGLALDPTTTDTIPTRTTTTTTMAVATSSVAA